MNLLPNPEKQGDNLEVKLLADHIVARLNRLEAAHPYVTSNQAYLTCKLAILREVSVTSETDEDLRSLYEGLLIALREIAEQRNGVRTIGKAKPLHVPTYLPASFDDLKHDLKAVRGPEVIEDAVESVAEEILFGHSPMEISGAKDYMPKIRNRVLKLLIYNDHEKHEIMATLREFGMEEAFRLLHLDDAALEAIVATEDFENLEESIIADVAHIVLAARDQVHHEQGRPTFVDSTGRLRDTPRPARHLRRVWPVDKNTGVYISLAPNITKNMTEYIDSGNTDPLGTLVIDDKGNVVTVDERDRLAIRPEGPIQYPEAEIPEVAEAPAQTRTERFAIPHFKPNPKLKKSQREAPRATSVVVAASPQDVEQSLRLSAFIVLGQGPDSGTNADADAD